MSYQEDAPMRYREVNPFRRFNRWSPSTPPMAWGQRHHPAWYYNLRAHPTATVAVGGVSRRVQAHEAVDEERERLWQRDLEVYPGRAAYQRRTGNRRIPVMVLTPVGGKAPDPMSISG